MYYSPGGKPLKKYNIIYADPPWRYDYCRSKKREIENHYETMTKNDLCELPFEKLANDNCVLFLWVTFPKLDWFLEIIKSWGFTYKTVGFVWVKKNKKSDSLFWGMGNYTRSNAEICIICTKGKPLKRISAKVHQIIHEPVSNHSKKPCLVRDKIIDIFGDLPRIELFAREKTPGWDVWGNEVESDIDLDDYRS